MAFGLFRIDPIDVPEHLALGRLIWETGAPVTSNHLSWTFPDHPMDQQYPLYQVALHLLQTQVGWWALSVFCCVTWTAAALAWLGWSGGLRIAAASPGLWFLAVVGVQRHLVARPEVFTLLGMGLLLMAWERWRRTQGRWPLVAMVATLWIMVNTHQMYVLGIILVAGFVAHLVVTRATVGRGWWLEDDATLPVAPLVVTLVAGIAVLALSPNGIRAWIAPVALITTVTTLGATGSDVVESDELAPIWTDPLGGPVAAILLGIVVVQGVRSWRRWHLYEIGVLAVCTGLVAVAMRGIPFFALAAAAVTVRWGPRGSAILPAESIVHPVRHAVTLLLAGTVLAIQWIPHPHAYLQRQQGLGRSIGGWGDEVTAFLRNNPPPGEMLNVGWVAANYLNYGVYPVKRVFVDGRWEAYPKPFLDDCMAMQRDQDTLDAMIAEWDPGFVVVEMRDRDQQQRIATLVDRGWALVYVDSIAAVAVRDAPDSGAYLATHRLAPANIDPGDWLPDHPILYAQQQARVARLLQLLGEEAGAEALRTEARRHADHPAVAAALAR